MISQRTRDRLDYALFLDKAGILAGPYGVEYFLGILEAEGISIPKPSNCLPCRQSFLRTLVNFCKEFDESQST